ncbi:VOC family protein [Vagococcus elongatus]|uniref:Glyoxalase n=1 Tax=Vagococcus elongatus TaxID=180344 RepID=A0A430B1Z8_9ENTE|nr:VOC family protein [Vagococcus elongatus]RSU14354.1 glyoxalase [Vagococcus elongatus]
MATMVFVNFPVNDLAASTTFYEKLGFKKNENFSDHNASCMVWDENFNIMLLVHDFYQSFIEERKVSDTQKTSGALIAFSLESAEAVKNFGELAKENGGHVYQVESGMPEEDGYGLEVQDLDGNTLEPMWMKM